MSSRPVPSEYLRVEIATGSTPGLKSIAKVARSRPVGMPQRLERTDILEFPGTCPENRDARLCRPVITAVA